VNDRAISKVVLQPEPGFRDPRSVHSCITKSPLGFNLGQGAAGGSVRPGISEFQEPFVSFVAADLSLRINNPSLQDVAPTVDHPGPTRRRGQASAAVFYRLLHGVVRTTTQFSRGAIRPGQVVGVEYLHELSIRLQVVSPAGTSIRLGTASKPPGEAATALARRAG
jgi:hypothetical protein